jgi:hypothetical protein
MNRRKFVGRSLAAGSAAACSVAGFPGIAAAHRVPPPSRRRDDRGQSGRVDSGIHVFKGIPYGDRRRDRCFMPPSGAPWTGIRAH